MSRRATEIANPDRSTSVNMRGKKKKKEQTIWPAAVMHDPWPCYLSKWMLVMPSLPTVIGVPRSGPDRDDGSPISVRLTLLLRRYH